MNKLKELDLDDNRFGDEGMEAFVEAVSKGGGLSNLKCLNLRWNEIGDEGMKAFAEALSKGALKRLKSLSTRLGLCDVEEFVLRMK